MTTLALLRPVSLALFIPCVLAASGAGPELDPGSSAASPIPPAARARDACTDLHTAALHADPDLRVPLCAEGRTRLVAGARALELLSTGAALGRCGEPTPTVDECEAALTALVYWFDESTRATAPTANPSPGFDDADPVRARVAL